jgi:hypothetical protein
MEENLEPTLVCFQDKPKLDDAGLCNLAQKESSSLDLIFESHKEGCHGCKRDLRLIMLLVAANWYRCCQEVLDIVSKKTSNPSSRGFKSGYH